MGSILSVLITAGLGTWLAYLWQQRSAKETRFFEASKAQHELMRQAARDIAALIGQRLYATHRVCRISKSNEFYEEAVADYRASIIQWNRQHLQMDLDIRTLFVGPAVVQFERLQGRLAALTNEVSRHLERVGSGTPPAYDIIRAAETLRGDYFHFLQGMIDEANNVFRQMHFGVRLKYELHDIGHFSTLDLVKVLFTGPHENSSVVRSPTNFGMPVSTRDARLGINQH